MFRESSWASQVIPLIAVVEKHILHKSRICTLKRTATNTAHLKGKTLQGYAISFLPSHGRLGLLGLLASGLGLGDVRLEVPDTDALLEELVELLVAATGRLDLVKVQVDDAQDAQAAKDEGRLGTEVGLVRVENVGDDKGPDGVNLFDLR